MKGNFQFKTILKFNIVDGLEHIKKKTLNERVKKKIKATKKKRERNYIYSKTLFLKILFFLSTFPLKLSGRRHLLGRRREDTIHSPESKPLPVSQA